MKKRGELKRTQIKISRGLRHTEILREQCIVNVSYVSQWELRVTCRTG